MFLAYERSVQLVWTVCGCLVPVAGLVKAEDLIFVIELTSSGRHAKRRISVPWEPDLCWGCLLAQVSTLNALTM